MKWKLSFYLFLLLMISVRGLTQQSISMGRVSLQFELDKSGTPRYSVSFGNKPVVLTSVMGFVLDVDSSFYQGFQVLSTEKRSVNESWQTVWGETRNVSNHYE